MTYERDETPGPSDRQTSRNSFPRHGDRDRYLPLQLGAAGLHCARQEPECRSMAARRISQYRTSMRPDGNSPHRYIVDLFLEFVRTVPAQWRSGSSKSSRRVSPSWVVPKGGKKRRPPQERIIAEAAVVKRNHCKWVAAVDFCKSRGWHFRIIHRAPE